MRNCLIPLYFVVTFFVSGIAGATSFIPLDFQRQLRESDGVLRGIYKGQDYKRLRGDIFTDSRFEVVEYSGIRPNEIINQGSFSVLFPGGKWQGLNYRIQGAPKFKKGEEYVLLINKGPKGYMLSNFTLGKYHLVESKEGPYLKSAVFPNDENLGSIILETANEYFKNEFGTKLSSVNGDLYIRGTLEEQLKFVEKTNLPEGSQAQIYKARGPASLSQQNNPYHKQRRSPANKKNETENSSFLWVALSFFAMGTYGAVMRRRQRDR